MFIGIEGVVQGKRYKIRLLNLWKKKYLQHWIPLGKGDFVNLVYKIIYYFFAFEIREGFTLIKCRM